MRSYSTARGIFSILEVIGWIMVAIGIFAAIALAGTTSRHAPAGAGLIAMLPGLGITVGGFLSVGLVQSWRANVDTAELTQQMLKVARDQLEVSQQALQKSNSTAQSFEAVAATSEKVGGDGYRSARTSDRAEAPDGNQRPALDASEVTRGAGGLLTYNGQSIAKAGGSYLVDGMPFASLEAAKTYINENRPRKT